MKLFRNVLAALALLAATLVPAPASAQFWTPIGPVTGSVVADDTDVALLVKFVGTAASGTVEVNAGDVLLKVGAGGAEVADTTVTGCGGTSGTLDVDNAACDTVRELVDRINASSNWVAVPLDALLADSTAGAKLLTRAATNANLEAGLGLFWDTSVSFDVTVALGAPRSIAAYIGGSSRTAANPAPNVFAGRQYVFLYANATSTYVSGTSFLRVYSCDTFVSRDGSSETANVLFEEAGGATTVNKIFNLFPLGIPGYTGQRVVVKLDNSAAMSAARLIASGVRLK